MKENHNPEFNAEHPRDEEGKFSASDKSDDLIYEKYHRYLESPAGAEVVKRNEAIDDQNYASESQAVERACSREALFRASLVAAMAKKNEAIITADIVQACRGSGGTMQGLEYRLKRERSIAGKIESKYQDKLNKYKKDLKNGLHPSKPTYGEAVNELGDTVRYTSVITSDKFAGHVDSVLTKLSSKGYKVLKFKDTFKDKVQYKGLNCNLLTPNGVKIELQFHTPESINAKMQICFDGEHWRTTSEAGRYSKYASHKYYEERRSCVKDERRNYLVCKLVGLWNKVPNPPQLESLSDKWNPTEKDDKMKIGGK